MCKTLYYQGEEVWNDASAVKAGKATNISYNHTGLDASTVYVYKVKAVNSAGTSPFIGSGTYQKTLWGGGSLAVTGFYSGTVGYGCVYALTINPSTYAEFDAVDDWAGYGTISNSTDTCDWTKGVNAPSDGVHIKLL